MFSGLKDVDREILKHVNDEELVKVCSTDRKTWNEVCDDKFLKRRLTRYPGIEKYKREDESYKQFFLRFSYYKFKLKEEHQFEYTFGDFKKQYELLEKYKGKWNELLFKAAGVGELAMVKYALIQGAEIHTYNDNALRYAVEKGRLEVVKFLVDKGANIHVFDDIPLRAASIHRHLDIVKYLVEHGANIHNRTLRNAVINNDLPMVKYLIEHGADMREALKLARRDHHSDIVAYLENLQ